MNRVVKWLITPKFFSTPWEYEKVRVYVVYPIFPLIFRTKSLQDPWGYYGYRQAHGAMMLMKYGYAPIVLYRWNWVVERVRAKFNLDPQTELQRKWKHTPGHTTDRIWDLVMKEDKL